MPKGMSFWTEGEEMQIKTVAMSSTRTGKVEYFSAIIEQLANTIFPFFASHQLKTLNLAVSHNSVEHGTP